MIAMIFALSAMTYAGLPPTDPKLPSNVDIDTIRLLAVQHDGRWPPLDTVARDMVETVTGQTDFHGHDPVALLLAWTFDPSAWQTAPLIPIRNAELRGELKLPSDRTTFSFSELLAHRPLRDLINSLAEIPEGQKYDPLQSKASEINSNLVLLQRVFSNQVIRPIPDPENASGAWHPIPLHDHEASEDGAAGTAWAALRTAFLADDAAGFAKATGELQTALAALPSAYRPPVTKLETELRYNALRPFHFAWMILLAGAVLTAMALFVKRRAFDLVALIPLVAGFALLTYGLWMRWHIADRIPASNMYESLLFLSWGTGAFAILSEFVLRDRMIPMTASVMGAVSLMLADVLPMDSFVRPIAPVLQDTVWMSIHVPVIMVSYSVLALAVLIAHVQLVMMALAPRKKALIDKIDALHYWYVHVGSILLAAGIITGSMWAASSWGRYWGWDPKEVWSLVALLGYLTILHVRTDPERTPLWGYLFGAALAIVLSIIVVPKMEPLSGMKLAALSATALAMIFFVVARGMFSTAVKSILAFWLIIMTYLGVNYVLGTGLHSYGFGTGAMTRYMMLIGVLDLLFVGLLWGVYMFVGRSADTGTVQPGRQVPQGA